MYQVKKLSAIAMEKLQNRIKTLEIKLKKAQQDNKEMKEDEMKRIECLENKLNCIQKQMSMERRHIASRMTREQMLRAFLKEKIRKLEERIEISGVDELQRIVRVYNI